MKPFLVNYLAKLKSCLEVFDLNAAEAILRELEAVHERRGRIFIFGNGSSATIASCLANDLAGGIKLREIRNFDVESLAENSALCTAIANDIGYTNVFYAQLKNRLTGNDLVIALSCSGNSENIVKAAEYARRQGARIVGLTGFDGGKLKALSDVCFHVPTERGEYGIVQDLHSVLNHLIYSYYVSLKAEAKTTYTLS